MFDYKATVRSTSRLGGCWVSEQALPAARSLCPCLSLCHCLSPPWQRLQKLTHMQTVNRYRERARESKLQAMHSSTNTNATLAASFANGKTKQKENARCACVRSFAGFHREWVSLCVPPCLCMPVCVCEVVAASFLSLSPGARDRRRRRRHRLANWTAGYLYLYRIVTPLASIADAQTTMRKIRSYKSGTFYTNG